MVNRLQVIATTVSVLTIGTVVSLPNKALAQRVVTCESEHDRTTTCAMRTEGGVRFVRQLSDASCRGNWGWRRGYVWVRNGCRAEFARK